MGEERAFNELLDRIMRGETVQVEAGADAAALRLAGQLAKVDFRDEMSARPDLQARWQSAARKVGTNQPVARRVNLKLVAWASAVALVLALLVIYRQPVIASLGRLFGYTYFPQVGFVRLDSARVLPNAVMQVHEGRSLTVLRGLVGTRDTQLWLEYSDEARPAEGAWLETPDGQRIDLLGWGWSPDEPGTRGVQLSFPVLPEDVTQVTLAMPEGWRIPLSWVPAADSGMQPVDLPLQTVAPTPQSSQPEDGIAAVDLPLVQCVSASQVELCVQAVVRTPQGLEILLQALSSGPLLPGSDYGRILLEPVMAGLPVELVDSAGNRYTPFEGMRSDANEDGSVGMTVQFAGAQNANGRVSLLIPAFYARVELAQEIRVDVGGDPQPGQTIPLDVTIDVAGTAVHFSQAVIEGDGRSNLSLRILSDPVAAGAEITPQVIHMGKPDAVLDHFGEGFGPDWMELRVELLQQFGLVTGELRLPLIGATVLVHGPFELSFDVSQAETAVEPTPEVVVGGEFIPLPLGESLPMDAFAYSGVIPQPGDLLAVAAGPDTSTLYATHPQDGSPAEVLATLPGQVMSVYLHPDRMGIDYLTGKIDPDRGNQYRQLYTLRFGESVPRLLVGEFERLAHAFTWSYDGTWLAYNAPRSGPGEDGRNQVRLVNMSCRDGSACASQVVVAPEGMDLFGPVWSPVENRLLVQGAPPDQLFGQADIFTVFIDGSTGEVSLTNLTQSPQIDDSSPVWLADGKSMLHTCSTGEMEINYYGLCRNDLVVGMDDIVIRRLPFNMRSVWLGKDGESLVDRLPVMQEGKLMLRLYNYASQETRTLIEWPAAKGEFLEPQLSAEGTGLAVIEPDMLTLLVIDIQTGQTVQVLNTGGAPITWVGWV